MLMFSCKVGECGPKRWLKGFNERKLLLLTIWFKLAEFFLEAERLFSDLTLEEKKLRENAG